MTDNGEDQDDLEALVKYFDTRREPSCGSRCVDLGRVHSLPHAQYPPYPEKLPFVYQKVAVGRRLDELHLVYIDSGSGWYTNDSGDCFPVRPGTALLLYPNAYHAYAPDAASGWSEYWVGCDGSYPRWLIEEDAFTIKNSLVRVDGCPGLREDFRQLCLLAASDQPAGLKAQLLGGCINRLLGRILVLQTRGAREGADDASSGSGLAVEAVRAYLDGRVEGEADMGELPGLSGMRYDRLSRLFQASTGYTPHQYYLQKKIEAAIVLLGSGLSVKETSFRLCFDSPYYFSRLFKKKTGSSPQEYKKQGGK